MRATTVLAAALLAAASALPADAAAQDLSTAVAGAPDGTVRFSFATRPGVEICDRGIRMGESHHVRWGGGGHDGWPMSCRPGPVDVEVRVRDGRVRSVETLHRGDRRDADARDLGPVPPRQAVDFLARVARGGSAGSGAAEDAVFPMVLADVPEVWEDLLGLARDRDVPRSARKNALFWLGQEAAEAATRGLARVAGDEEEEQEVREAAVFALSQRPDEEGVPVLMELARTASQAETRRTALFWLAQSDAPEVVDFFAEILRGGGDDGRDPL